MNKKNKKEVSPTSSNIRSLTFTFELYPEWPFITTILDHLKTCNKYAYILHDKDVNDNGELKKKHIHAMVKYGGRRTLSSVQNEFFKYGLEKRFCDTCNERAMLRYFTHIDDPDKYQYSIDDIVQGNMKSEIEIAYTDEITPEIAFKDINTFIKDTEGYISQYDLNIFCINKGYLSGLRKYGVHINRARDEHNANYRKDNINNLLRESMETRAQIQKAAEDKKMVELVESFGCTTVEINGEEYTITKKKVYENPPIK
ncbi:MAG: hypothetical protein IKD76_03655 [Clostridia bacterium]|nr:hypothetical protein [Clostridia bacterium]